MPNDKEPFVGIDISKDWFDVAVLGEKRTRQFANTKKGIRDLVRWMSQVQPELIVVEASGGYEEALVGRRNQLNAMLQAEKNRLQMHSGAIHSTLLQQHTDLQAQEKLLRTAKSIGAVTAATLLADLPELGQLDRQEVAAWWA